MKKLMILAAILLPVCAKAAEPSPAQFANPPIEARAGAYWVWLNGNVDLAQITHELEEMKAKGMSGAEIWDVGLIRPNPDMTVAAGPAFLGPESLAAIHHAINEATRLGLRLGLVTSSSWNEGGSWVEPKDALKALYVSEITVTGPAKIARKLPFPPNRATKGADGLPLYHQEIAVLAFPRCRAERHHERLLGDQSLRQDERRGRTPVGRSARRVDRHALCQCEHGAEACGSQPPLRRLDG